MNDRAKRLIEASEMDVQIERSVNFMIGQIKATLGQEMHELSDEMEKNMRDILQAIKAAILEYAAEIYTEILSPEEIDALIAFHNSPLAVRMRKLSPEIMQKVGIKTQELLKEYLSQRN